MKTRNMVKLPFEFTSSLTAVVSLCPLDVSSNSMKLISLKLLEVTNKFQKDELQRRYFF